METVQGSLLELSFNPDDKENIDGFVANETIQFGGLDIGIILRNKIAKNIPPADAISIRLIEDPSEVVIVAAIADGISYYTANYDIGIHSPNIAKSVADNSTRSLLDVVRNPGIYKSPIVRSLETSNVELVREEYKSGATTLTASVTRYNKGSNILTSSVMTVGNSKDLGVIGCLDDNSRFNLSRFTTSSEINFFYPGVNISEDYISCNSFVTNGILFTSDGLIFGANNKKSSPITGIDYMYDGSFINSLATQLPTNFYHYPGSRDDLSIISIVPSQKIPL